MAAEAFPALSPAPWLAANADEAKDSDTIADVINSLFIFSPLVQHLASYGISRSLDHIWYACPAETRFDRFDTAWCRIVSVTANLVYKISDVPLSIGSKPRRSMP